MICHYMVLVFEEELDKPFLYLGLIWHVKLSVSVLCKVCFWNLIVAAAFLL